MPPARPCSHVEQAKGISRVFSRSGRLEVSRQGLSLLMARVAQQEVFQNVLPFAAGKRFATVATPDLAVDGLRPRLSLNKVIQHLALRTVEEQPIAHTQLAN
jgi:hypothetical protein